MARFLILTEVDGARERVNLDHLSGYAPYVEPPGMVEALPETARTELSVAGGTLVVTETCDQIDSAIAESWPVVDVAKRMPPTPAEVTLNGLGKRAAELLVELPDHESPHPISGETIERVLDLLCDLAAFK